MRRFISALIISGLCASPIVFAQDSGTKTEAKKAGDATKDAAKDTGSAAKHAGKAVVNGTKKTARATKNAVQHDYTCVDGTIDKATVKANACKDHGGVQVTAKVKS